MTAHYISIFIHTHLHTHTHDIFIHMHTHTITITIFAVRTENQITHTHLKFLNHFYYCLPNAQYPNMLLKHTLLPSALLLYFTLALYNNFKRITHI